MEAEFFPTPFLLSPKGNPPISAKQKLKCRRYKGGIKFGTITCMNLFFPALILQEIFSLLSIYNFLFL